MEPQEHKNAMEIAVVKEQVSNLKEDVSEVKENVSTIMTNHLPHIAADIQKVQASVEKSIERSKPALKTVYKVIELALTGLFLFALSKLLN